MGVSDEQRRREILLGQATNQVTNLIAGGKISSTNTEDFKIIVRSRYTVLKELYDEIIGGDEEKAEVNTETRTCATDDCDKVIKGTYKFCFDCNKKIKGA